MSEEQQFDEEVRYYQDVLGFTDPKIVEDLVRFKLSHQTVEVGQDEPCEE